MAENRIRLGPFALKLIAKHGPKGAPPDGKVLDDLLTKAFADGRAFDLGAAGEITDKLADLPEWESYRADLLSQMLGALDGHGDESLDSFEKLNKRVGGLEKSIDIMIKNQLILDKKIMEVLEEVNRRNAQSKDWF